MPLLASLSVLIALLVIWINHGKYSPLIFQRKQILESKLFGSPPDKIGKTMKWVKTDRRKQL